MTKKLLSLVLALAMVLTLFAGLTLTSHAAYSGTGDFVKTTGALESGYYVFTNNNNQAANDKNSSNNWLTYTAVTVGANDTITDPAAEVVWYFDAAAGTLQSYDDQTLYLNWPTTGNTAKAATTATTVAISDTGSGVYNITASDGARVLRFNSTGWRFYASTSTTGSADITFYKYAESTSGGHVHSWGAWYSNNNGTHSRDCDDPDGDCTEPTQTADCTYGDPVIVAATCSATGTSTQTCTVCGYANVTTLAINPDAHTDEDNDGVCDDCGEDMPNEITGDIVFADLGLTNSQQYLDPFTSDNGMFTVKFGDGGNDGKYYNTGSGIRVYQNGYMKVSAVSGTITKIEITCAGTSYQFASSDADSGNFDGSTWTGSAAEVTFTRAASGQCRIQAVSVTVAGSSGSVHTHTWGNWYSNNDGTHSRDCDDPDGDCPDPTQTANCTYDAGVVTTPATCIAAGVKTYTCSVCGYSYTEPVAATGIHVDEDGDGVCDNCGDDMPEAKTYTLGTALADGDEVVIVYNGNTALSITASGAKLAGAAVAPSNGTLEITDPTVAALTVEYSGDTNFYLKAANGQYLTAPASGNGLSFEASPAADDCSLWYLTAVDTTNNTVGIMSVGANYNGNHNQAMEYYSGFTTYGWKDNNSAYVFSLYIYEAPAAPSDDVDVYVIDKTNSQGGVKLWAWNAANTQNIADNWNNRPAMTLEGQAVADKEYDYAAAYNYYKFTYNKATYNGGLLFTCDGGQTDNLAVPSGNVAVYYLYNDNGIQAGDGGSSIWVVKETVAATCTTGAYTVYEDALGNEADYTGPAGQPNGHNIDTATWLSDATGHWHACENGCGEKLDFAAHADGDDDGFCDTCNYEMPTEKTLAIVADNNGTKYVMGDTLTNNGYGVETEVTLTADNKLSSADATGNSFTIAYVDDTYFTIKAGSVYLGGGAEITSGGKAFVTSDTANGDNYLWSETENGIACKENGNTIQYNSGAGEGSRFRVYKSGSTSGKATSLLEIDNTPPAPLPEEVDIYVVDQTHDGIANIHYWGDNVSTTFPGIAINDASVENLGLDKDGNAVYKFTLDKNDSGAGIIFSNNNGSYKTADLNWVGTDLAANDGTYIVYYVFDGDGAMGASAPQNGDVWLESSKTTVPPTCTEAGYDKYVGLITGAENTNNEVPATGHNFENGVCTVCGAEEGKIYEKVTAAPADWSGKYLLVYEADPSTAYVYTGVDNTNEYVEASINNNAITSADGMAEIEIAAMEGGYSLKVVGGANDGKYMYGTNNSNKTNYSDEAQLNTIALSEGAAVITSNTSFIQFNSTSGQMRFRYYKSGTTSQQPVQLYKLVETAPAGVTASYSITTGAKIGINLYFDNLPDGATVEVDGTAVTLDNNVYTIDLAAKDYETEFVVTVNGGATQVNGADSLTVSVPKYIEDITSSTNPAAMAASDVVKAMGNFCAFAEGYFGNTDVDLTSLYAVNPDYAALTADDISVPAGTVKNPDSGNVFFYGASLVLESETVLRFYFKVNENAVETNIDSLTVKDADNNDAVYTTKFQGKYVCVSVPVVAKDLAKGYTVTLKYNGEEASIANYAATTYIKQVLGKDTADEKLVNTLKTLYVYYLAAHAYFG